MIDKKTVFILGAGASCPYGYPSGAQLREKIINYKHLLSLHSQYTELLNPIQNDRYINDIKHFSKTFDESTTPSIDLFLARNPSFVEIGKYVIALVIFDAENNSKFREKSEHNFDWYFFLYSKLTGSALKIEQIDRFSDNISFLTFNYDRSFEHFLFESLNNSFSETPEEKIAEKLNEIKIIHIYGQIAPLPWQNKFMGTDYKRKISLELLLKYKENLKTIYEEKDSPELCETKKLIEKAEQIFFLGFGYAKENMEVLKLLENISPHCTVIGTGFNLEDKEINDIRKMIINGRKQVPNIYNNPNNVKIENMDCLKLLRNYL